MNKYIASFKNELMTLKNSSVKNSRRDNILIVSDMLAYAIKGTGKCELMVRTGLNSAQINKFVPKLLKSELLEEYVEKEKLLYRTTVKGRLILGKIRGLNQLIS